MKSREELAQIEKLINSGAKEINLSNQKLNNEDIKQIAALIKNNKHIEKLYLANNSIGDEGLIALINALDNDTVTFLDLNNNAITNRGGLAIATLLEKNKRLATLGLSQNLIGSEGINAIAKAVESNTTLKILTLAQNNFNDDSLASILGLVQKNQDLQLLFINTPKLTKEAKAQIKTAAQASPIAISVDANEWISKKDTASEQTNNANNNGDAKRRKIGEESSQVVRRVSVTTAYNFKLHEGMKFTERHDTDFDDDDNNNANYSGLNLGSKR